MDERTLVDKPVQATVRMNTQHAWTNSEALEGFACIRQHLTTMTDEKKCTPRRAQKALDIMAGLESTRAQWVKNLLGPRTMGKNTSCRVEGEQSATKAPVTVHSKAQLPQMFQAQKTRVETRRITRNITNEAYAHSVPAGTQDVAERKIILSQLGNEPLTTYFGALFVENMKIGCLSSEAT
jgi:hypothetical protein